jgi:hypothetical protein
LNALAGNTSKKSVKTAKKAAAKRVAAKAAKKAAKTAAGPRSTAPKSQFRRVATPALLAGGNP